VLCSKEEEGNADEHRVVYRPPPETLFFRAGVALWLELLFSYIPTETPFFRTFFFSIL